MERCSHNDKVSIVPAVSPFLWLRATPLGSVPNPLPSSSLPEIISEADEEKQDLHQLLSNAKSVKKNIPTSSLIKLNLFHT